MNNVYVVQKQLHLVLFDCNVTVHNRNDFLSSSLLVKKIKKLKTICIYIFVIFFANVWWGIFFFFCCTVGLFDLASHRQLNLPLMLLMDQRKSQATVFELQKLQSDCALCSVPSWDSWVLTLKTFCKYWCINESVISTTVTALLNARMFFFLQNFWI